MINKIEIGRIVNTHGIKGEVKVTPWCDHPTVFETLKCLYDAKDNVLEIVRVRYHKNSVILTLMGVSDINTAETYKGLVVYANRGDLEQLPDGSYYIRDLIGLQVETDDGRVLGKMTDCFPTGSNDVYVVKTTDKKDILLPAIPQVIKEVKLDEGKMIVTLMKGLVDDEV
ncbi:MAG: ribosome maturation factor RimM [Eubacteriales bacterium]|nr:ribosome maturation factor RimM [Eubacteriales bacterium]